MKLYYFTDCINFCHSTFIPSPLFLALYEIMCGWATHLAEPVHLLFIEIYSMWLISITILTDMH